MSTKHGHCTSGRRGKLLWVWVPILAVVMTGGWLLADRLCLPVPQTQLHTRGSQPALSSQQGSGTGLQPAPEPIPEPVDPLERLDGVLLEELVGRMMMVGINSEWSSRTPGVLETIHPGFVILYGRNVTSRAQVEKLVDNMVAFGSDWPLGEPVVAIDHEGGRVNRLRISGVTAFPDNHAMAARGIEAVAAEGRTMARELLGLGIAMDLAPVVDVTTNPQNHDIGNRSYGSNTDQVSQLGGAFIKGAEAEGLLSVAKHFPGYGPIAENPHDQLPVVEMSSDRWREECLPPFEAAIEAGVTGVMTGHVVYPALDPARVPATLSEPIITGLLRTRMGFDGLILTDDLEMGAIISQHDIGTAAVRSVQAGSDVILVCHTPARQTAAHSAIVEAVQAGTIDRRRIEQSVARIQAATGATYAPPARTDDLEAVSAAREG